MELSIPRIILLELRFRALAPINHLPHYHGGHWSALFRNILRPYLPEAATLDQAGVWVHPIETGVLSYEAGDAISLGLSFPQSQAGAVSGLLRDFNSLQSNGGHFQPGKTIVLEAVTCRITGETWNPESPWFLSSEIIEEETMALSRLERFSMHFTSPMRLKRPEGEKTEGHRYCDDDFFLRSVDPGLPMKHFLHSLSSCMALEGATETAPTLYVSGGALSWLDLSYGTKIVKTIGGVVGKILIAGSPSLDEARLLVVGQYTGAGKNAVFGLGFYTIPELDAARKIKPLERAMPLLRKAMTVNNLKAALMQLPESSPGPDSVTVQDVKKGGEFLLASLESSVVQGDYVPGPPMKARLPKAGGGCREIVIQNVVDRLVQRATADCLLPAIDGLLSGSSYAYRRGLNRKGAAQALKKALAEGYTGGIKADISAFFDSVNIVSLVCLMEGLFPFEPLVDRISQWLTHAQASGAKGLPQGNPLSPMLSNLYLDRFDREMERKGFRLVRFADDFVVLFKTAQDQDQGLREVELSLAALGLKLNPEKTQNIAEDGPIRFLGYEVTASSIVEYEKEQSEEDGEWPPVFREHWRTGTPVYLTSACLGAYSSGPSLVIKQGENRQVALPWSKISRLVIVGRSPFSGGVVYRAVREGLPVTFIDVMGRTRGNLYPEDRRVVELTELQEERTRDREFRLAFSRELIAAKINNSAVLLKRNHAAAPELKTLEKKALTAADFDALRGYEGAAARAYFSALAGIVGPFEFRGRVYRPPDGPVNVMLSLGYTLLYNRIAAVLKDKGFEPKLGFFHEGRGAHAALASDLVEELRHISERITLALIHRGEIKPEDFSSVDRWGTQTCRMNGEGFRKYIQQYETTMSRKASYQSEDRMSYNAYLDEMADNLRRALKLKIPYRPLRID